MRCCLDNSKGAGDERSVGKGLIDRFDLLFRPLQRSQSGHFFKKREFASCRTVKMPRGG
jgi:hypothetical protein